MSFHSSTVIVATPVELISLWTDVRWYRLIRTDKVYLEDRPNITIELVVVPRGAKLLLSKILDKETVFQNNNNS
jgi:hypothetical protein